MDDLAGRAVTTGYAASKFLTPAEKQSIITHFARRRDVALSFDGGFDGAERMRAVFLNADWGAYDRTEYFVVLSNAFETRQLFLCYFFTVNSHQA